MAYHYDLWGWYDGDVPKGSDRSTEIVPPVSKDPSMVPNWTGYKWELQPYKAPPVQTDDPTPTAADSIVGDPKAIAKLKAAMGL